VVGWAPCGVWPATRLGLKGCGVVGGVGDGCWVWWWGGLIVLAVEVCSRVPALSVGTVVVGVGVVVWV